MNQLTTRDVGQHVQILGWLYIISHAIFLIIGAFIFMLLTGVGAFTNDPQAVAILSIVGTFVGLFLAALSLPGLAAGIGLLTRKPWARILAIVVGILNLANMPLGTLIGLYTMWVLLQEAATDYFAPAIPVH
jgi:hypothetical protein